jgi:hypothetical protein
LAHRHEKPLEAKYPEQHQLFDTPEYTHGYACTNSTRRSVSVISQAISLIAKATAGTGPLAAKIRIL